MGRISVIGVSCFYPDAPDIASFWENILSLRQAFRHMPKGRLNLEHYGSDDPADQDRTYLKKAALISEFDFDWRENFVPKASYDVTDISHWLALDCARKAFQDADLDLEAADRSRIGVVVGNSLTGEMSRANSLRLRWPYVQEVITRCGRASGLDGEALGTLVTSAEHMFKSQFPAPNEDWLAGVLANVVAGRICNRLDLNGGGFTVDGACASSLLAVKSGCEMLKSGDLDVVLAGGVDISLDPLEAVGFARTGALTKDRMRVYDKSSSGFIPGEGCGFVLLVREEDAIRTGAPVWAALDGWGISSDGAGGITAPKSETQAMALQRCYALAGHAAADLDFIEGHGTGTPTGDRVELTSIISQTGEADPSEEPLRAVGVTSIKSLIGHTKAAAGIAGLLKCALAVNQRVLPPMAGPETNSPLFDTEGARIYPISRARKLAPTHVMHAGVSSAGFGGINCHVGLSSPSDPPRDIGATPADVLSVSHQARELLIASGSDTSAVRARLLHLADLAEGMAESELADFVAQAALDDRAGACRSALVLGSGTEAADEIQRAASAIENGDGALPPGFFMGAGGTQPKVGFLFPGQGAQFGEMGTVLRHRHAWAAARAERWDAKFAHLHEGGLSGLIEWPQERCFDAGERERRNAALRDTRAAQPAIVMTSLQWLDFLRQCGVMPAGAAGHSLGEISAMVVTDLLDEREAMELLRVRADGAAGVEGSEQGAMASLGADIATAERLIAAVEGYAVVANQNAPEQTVIAGESDAISRVVDMAGAEGLNAVRLNVSTAFHSRYMEHARTALSELAERRGGEERRALLPFYSGVTGEKAPKELDPYSYLTDQVIQPVKFADAARALMADCDVLIELGPGSVLTGLVGRIDPAARVRALEPAMQGFGHGLCEAFAELYTAGQRIDWSAFYANRLIRPFVPAARRRFLENPAQLASSEDDLVWQASVQAPVQAPVIAAEAPSEPASNGGGSVASVLRELIANETGYDVSMMKDDARLIADLNLDSIKIGEIIAGLKSRGVTFADDLIMSSGTIAEIAAASQTEDAAPAVAPQTSSPCSPAIVDTPTLSLGITWRAEDKPGERLSANSSAVVIAPQSRRRETDELVSLLRAADLDAEHRSPADEPAAVDRVFLVLPEIAFLAESADLDAFQTLAALLADAAPWLRDAASVVILAIEPDVETTTASFAAALAQSVSLERAAIPVLGGTVTAAMVDEALPWLTGVLTPGAHPLRFNQNNAERLTLTPATGEANESAIASDDLIVASGGAKGITAACCLALGQETGARFALLGRSQPDNDPEVAETLRRFEKAGVAAIYLSVDVTDAASVTAALAKARASFGDAPLAGIVHGAGINRPATLGSLEAASIGDEIAVKCGGLAHLLAAVAPEELKLCISFSSIIGVTGMQGNIGYAMANALVARQLDHFAKRAPHSQCACLAYGVWEEVGMGAKLGVLERLRDQGIQALPVKDGVAWFLRAAATKGLPLPLVVARPMTGMPTWQAARRSGPVVKGDFLGKLIIDEPDFGLLARYDLTVASAPWLEDHKFNGTRLMPLVFVLRAMAEAAAALKSETQVLRVDDVEITAAISVGAEETVSIDIDVRPDEDAVLARVGTAGNAPEDAKFRAQLRFADTDAIPTLPAVTGAKVPPEVGAALYDWLLFQGPSFQRIECLKRVDLTDPVRRKALMELRRDATNAPMPDPYFLDAMLQAMQILVPQDICLPTAVRSIRFFPGAHEAGRAFVWSQILEQTETGYIGRITAADTATGAIIAEIDGLILVAATRHQDRPDLPEILDSLSWDEAQLARFATVAPPGLILDLSSLAENDREERREAARARIAFVENDDLSCRLSWTEEGAPILEGEVRSISISHDGGRLLMALGPDVLGCDLQTVGRRGSAWQELLPERCLPLWRELAGKISNPDFAAAITWAVDECLKKAGRVGDVPTVDETMGAQVRLTAPGCTIHADILQLSLAGPAAVALALSTPDTQPMASINGSGEPITHFHAVHRMSFKEALPPMRSAPASVVFSWIGTMREAAMQDINDHLMDAFLNQSKGILTNMTEATIHRPPQFGREIHCWVWLDKVLESAPSTFDLRFDFAQSDDDGTLLRCASGRQRLTWVHLEPDGTPRIEPFPKFFDGFIKRRTTANGAESFRPLSQLKETSWETPDPDLPAEDQIRRTYDLDDSHSNFVGNIYFAHLGTLAERSARIALSQQIGRGLYCRHLRLDHIGEAMPGDTVEVTARRTPDGAKCELMNLSRGGSKIGLATADYALVPPAGQTPAYPSLVSA